jgi:hypothetical protein
MINVRHNISKASLINVCHGCRINEVYYASCWYLVSLPCIFISTTIHAKYSLTSVNDQRSVLSSTFVQSPKMPHMSLQREYYTIISCLFRTELRVGWCSVGIFF